MISKGFIRFLAIIACVYALLGNPMPLQAAPSGKILRVNPGATGSGDGSSWINAYNSLQAALTAAASGDELWVVSGLYTPTLLATPGDNRTATFQLKNGVNLYGGFAGSETSREQRNWKTNLTVLSGDIDNNDAATGGVVTTPAGISGSNAYHVVSGVSGVTATLDGFVITAGKADTADGPHNRGAGLRNNGGTLRLNNLTLIGNQAKHGGGLINESGSRLTVVNATFKNNIGTASGGGLFDDQGTITVVNSIFDNNSAHDGGGAYFRYDVADVANVIFSNNNAEATGGGLWNEAAHPNVVNSTFFNNSAVTDGGAIYNWGHHTLITVQNSILWDNLAAANPQINASGHIVNYSLVQGGWTGTGNIDSDPMFISTANSNFCLRSISPAIDAGNTSLVLADTPDLDGDGNTSEPMPLDVTGHSRLVDRLTHANTGVGTPPVDMGACEALNPTYVALLKR